MALLPKPLDPSGLVEDQHSAILNRVQQEAASDHAERKVTKLSEWGIAMKRRAELHTA